MNKHNAECLALKIRIGIVEEIKARGFGHIGGSLSVADELAVLYGEILRVDPANPKWPDRDKVVFSKGHAGPAEYAALAAKGFIPWETLRTLNQPGTILPSHCDRLKTPGVDMTTGSLGQGTSQSVGLALGDRLKGRDSRTYLFAGDGEMNEGQVWEAAMFTAAKKVTNLFWLLDVNGKQLDGPTADIMDMGSIEKQFDAFGFEVRSIDGNDVDQLYDVLSRPAVDRPVAVIMHTVKGAGVPDVENTAANHSMTVGPETCDGWLNQLNAQLATLEKEAVL